MGVVSRVAGQASLRRRLGVAWSDVDVLKMDVEGFEWAVFTGLQSGADTGRTVHLYGCRSRKANTYSSKGIDSECFR